MSKQVIESFRRKIPLHLVLNWERNVSPVIF